MKSCHAISVTNYFKEKKTRTNTFSVNIGPQMNMELNVTNVLGSFNLNRPLTIIRKNFHLEETENHLSEIIQN